MRELVGSGAASWSHPSPPKSGEPIHEPICTIESDHIALISGGQVDLTIEDEAITFVSLYSCRGLMGAPIHLAASSSPATACWCRSCSCCCLAAAALSLARFFLALRTWISRSCISALREARRGTTWSTASAAQA